MKEELNVLFDNLGFGPFEYISLDEARDYVQEALATGEMVDCPCCGQTVKKYRRPIYIAMIGALAYIHQNGPVKGSKVQKECAYGAYNKLVHWDLIQQSDNGNWMISEKGKRFLLEKEQVPKYVYLYNNQVLYFSNDTICVDDIKKNFDLGEIMG